MSGVNKKKIILSAGILLLAVIGAMIAFRGGSSKRLAAQLDLGNRYLEDMDYEQAVVAFTKAIQIDPMSVEAHLGLVEAYIRSGEFEEALEAAKKGYELTKDARLKEKVDMIESGSIFDSLGRAMKTTFYDQNGDVSGWITHAYNARGEVLAIAYDRTGKETDRFKGDVNRYGYRVSPDGSGVSLVDAGENAGAGYSQIEYNESAQPNRLDNYDENGKLNGYTLYEYDENWQMTKESYYGLSGEPRGYSTYEYDENGNTIRTEQYDSNGTMTNYNIAEYDESGKLICWKTYDADGNLISESNF